MRSKAETKIGMLMTEGRLHPLSDDRKC
jgi:hypothetical protein